jgi:hypothetical protein
MAAPGEVVTIGFDSLAPGEQLVALPAQGVTFAHAVEGVRCDPDPVTRQGSNCLQARSGNMAARTLLAGEFSRHTVDVELAAPQEAVIVYVRLDAGADSNGAEVTVVMNGYAPDGAFIGSTTKTFVHQFNDGQWHELRVERGLPLCLPGLPCEEPPPIQRIEVWGGPTSEVGSPPEKGRATNFLLVDNLTLEGESAPLPEDNDAPVITILDAPATVDHEPVAVHLLVEERGPAEVRRLASVDLRVVHESGAIILAFTGGNLCGGPGSAGECPPVRLDQIVSVPLASELEGRYTVSFAACDAGGNCAPPAHTTIRLERSEPPPPPVDLEAYGVEVTQSVQNLHQWARLVANKRTFVRFYARTAEGVHWTRAVLRAEKDGLDVWLFPLNPGVGVNVSTFPLMGRGTGTGAFLFELPEDFRAGTVTLTAIVNPDLPFLPWTPTPMESDHTNNSYTTTVTFEEAPPLNLGIGRVGYRRSGTDFWPDMVHVDHLLSWLRAAYPISDLRFTVANYWWGGGKPSCHELNRRMEFMAPRADTGGPRRLYGMVDDGGGFMRGCAGGGPRAEHKASGPAGDPATTGWSWDTDDSYADWYGGHELGHTLGLPHVPVRDPDSLCGRPDGSAYYPYEGGRISPYIGPGSPWGTDAGLRLYGFDTRTQQVYTDFWHDMMTYCDYQWISDYNYNRLLDRLQRSAAPASGRPVAAGAAERTDRLVVAGTLDLATHAVALEPLFVNPVMEEPAPRIPGDYAIVLRDGAGAELARYPFTPGEIHTGPPLPGEPVEEMHVAEIAEYVPYVQGVMRVEIEGPGGALLASVSAGANLPTITITAPSSGETLGGEVTEVAWKAADLDGDPLAFLVQYSPDGGANWQTVVFPTTATTLAIPTENLPGGTQGRFRVLASDGVHTAWDESAPVTVPNRPPTVQITSPAAPLTALISQTVHLAAFAYDPDLGSLGDEQLVWRSSIDGVLGAGDTLSLAGLSAGAHTLILEANDGVGGVATATAAVTIVDDLALLPPATNALVASSSLIHFWPLAKRTSELLLIDNQNGEHSIRWKAEASEPWVLLSSTSGVTPQVITVSFGDANLPPGSHHALITLSSPDVAEQQKNIQLRAVIPGADEPPLLSGEQKLYLPRLMP